MQALMTVEELAGRLPPDTLPLDSHGDTDVPRIELALLDATGVIVARLPWLLDTLGELTDPIPAQFANGLKAICKEIALYNLTDKVSSSEDDRLRYKDNMTLLDRIDTEYKGGLSGPGLQISAVVEPSETEGIPDMRFWKKGRLI